MSHNNSLTRYYHFVPILSQKSPLILLRSWDLFPSWTRWVPCFPLINNYLNPLRASSLSSILTYRISACGSHLPHTFKYVPTNQLQIPHTQECVYSGIASGPYTEGSRFESRLGHELCGVFRRFPQSPLANSRTQTLPELLKDSGASPILRKCELSMHMVYGVCFFYERESS